ncbi:MAG: AAA family ATPase [Brachymonas sp.]|nr:AAA family ATPase [Brachymonas sp.]
MNTVPAPEPASAQASEALITRLRDAAIARGEADVQLLQTHISWILLAGDFAYKFKKPLKLDFLDFSTLALRHAACQEELRINRRTAPDLYLRVLPVTGSVQAPRIGGHTDGHIDSENPPLEWAVRMRRFPARSLMAEMAARGELAAAHVDALARAIAAFQAQAAVAPAGSPWGRAADLAQLAQDNFKVLLAPGCLPAAHEPLQQLQQWTSMQSQRLAPLMEERRAAGHVREGHGDLHLGNLLWLHGQPLLFDAIEFNPALRWLDTACDIAFLFMDLHAHGLPALAWRLLNAWLERTGDYAALPRLPYDAVYRALVRAKVAALRADGDGGDTAHAAPAQQEALRYIHLATELARPRQPWLALTHGVSGSGKSSQSQGLIEQRGLVRVRADVERKRLFGLPPEASSAHIPGGIYTRSASDQTFARLLDVARIALQAGQPVLVDATFIQRERRAPFIELARQLGLPWCILSFNAPEHVLRERLRQRQVRGDDASEAGEAVLLDQLAHVEPFTVDEQAHLLRLDTAQAVNWTSTWPLLQKLLGLKGH